MYQVVTVKSIKLGTGDNEPSVYVPNENYPARLYIEDRTGRIYAAHRKYESRANAPVGVIDTVIIKAGQDSTIPSKEFSFHSYEQFVEWLNVNKIKILGVRHTY